MTRDIIPLFRSCTTVLRPSTAAAVEIDSGLSISDNGINPVFSVPIHAMPLLRNRLLKTRRQDCEVLTDDYTASEDVINRFSRGGGD